MKRWLWAGLVILVLAGSTWGEVKIKGETKVASNKIVRLSADGLGKGAKCRWKVEGGKADCERVGDRLLFTGADGEYTVSLLVIDFDEKDFSEAEVTVTIGGGGPTPPIPPGPVDDLTKAIVAAWKQETATDRVKQVQFLAGFFKGASVLVDQATTVADLYASLQAGILSPTGLKKGDLPAVQKVVTARLATDLGSTGALDKAKAKASLVAIGAALGTLTTAENGKTHKKIERRK